MEIPIEANVAVAIVVVPLNSALNPFLYTLNILREKIEARQIRRLHKKVERQIAADYISCWVETNVLSHKDIHNIN